MPIESTPGPWEVYNEIHVRSVNGINRYICTCSGNARSNARLIASAPALLAALESIVLSPHAVETKTYRAARAAINKARGTSEKNERGTR